MTLVQKIESLIATMTTYGFTFIYADQPEQNLVSDDTPSPWCFLYYPLNSTDDLYKSGALSATTTLLMLFAKKSEPDWTTNQHETDCIEPMRTAARKFLTLLQNDPTIKTVIGGQREDVKNYTSVNMSGCILRCQVELVDASSICV